jgi:hypothetical protein
MMRQSPKPYIRGSGEKNPHLVPGPPSMYPRVSGFYPMECRLLKSR